MSLKRKVVEFGVGVAARFAPALRAAPDKPGRIFVLRNNDIGDLVVITPLFEALKRRFPDAQVVAGVGNWNFPILTNNPSVDVVLPMNAPWHNKFLGGPSPRTLAGLKRSLSYIYRGTEVAELRALRCDIGIDVLGSPEGSLLMMQAGIPWRLGVRGYAGGSSACQQSLLFDPKKAVGTAALGFAELLGATTLPSAQPQIFLSQEEKAKAEATWSSSSRGTGLRRRILVAPGGGLAEKCWPPESFRELVSRLAADHAAVDLIVVGGKADVRLGEMCCSGSSQGVNLCGQTSLRETFALIAAADGVLCNSSMVSHVAAAFRRPTVVLLGEAFASAREHALLWGHGGQDLHLGRDLSHPAIYSPDEALGLVTAHLAIAS